MLPLTQQRIRRLKTLQPNEFFSPLVGAIEVQSRTYPALTCGEPALTG